MRVREAVRARSVDVHRAVRDVERDRLKVSDRLAERLSRVDVFARRLEP